MNQKWGKDGVVVRVFDSLPKGFRFEAQLPQSTSLQSVNHFGSKLFTVICLCMIVLLLSVYAEH